MNTGSWWVGATIYHAYVRSFRDSDGDGYGDLGGLIEGLPYLQWLGVTGLWLSPIMSSPNRDWGYDVSDYCAVHPELGTMADLDRLVEQAGNRGIRVILDLVPNHTSSAHPWFRQARQSPTSSYRDYYVWADARPDGSLPNNWLDDTGVPAWTWDEAAGQYYLHNFLDSQPDLNWWSPAVHREFEAILKFWFDRGIAGFRIDVANGLYFDPLLRDNPSHPDAHIYGAVQGRYGQQHVHNFNQPEVHDVYRRWRTLAEERTVPPLLMGETWVAKVDELAPYYGDADELQLALNFPLIFAPFSAPALAKVVADSVSAFPAGSCAVWAGSNHDIPRLATRWADGDARKARLVQLILGLLPGTFVLYYGDELGMVDSDIPAELHRDPLTLGGFNGQWPRDNARAPMRWSPDQDGGFSSGNPWLPVHPDADVNVATERDEPHSMLSLLRAVIALRTELLGSGSGGYHELKVSDSYWSFASGPLTVIANFSDAEITVELPGVLELSSRTVRSTADTFFASHTVAPWEAIAVTPSDIDPGSLSHPEPGA